MNFSHPISSNISLFDERGALRHVDQDAPEALSCLVVLIKRFLSVQAQIASLYENGNQVEEGMVLSQKQLITYLRHTILQPIKDLSDEPSFWGNLLYMIAYALESKARYLVRDQSGILKCITPGVVEAPEWAPEMRGYDLFIASNSVNNFFESIVITEKRCSFMGGNQLVKKGIDLSGRSVVVKHHIKDAISQNIINYHLFLMRNHLKYHADIYGVSHELVYMDESSPLVGRVILIEKQMGPSLWNILFGSAELYYGQKEHFALSAIQAVAGMHQAGFCHGDLSLKNLLLGEDGQLVHTDLGLYFLNRNGARYSGDLLFQPFELRDYLSGNFRGDYDLFAKRADNWSLGAVLFCIFFPHARLFLSKIKEIILNPARSIPEQREIDQLLFDSFQLLSDCPRYEVWRGIIAGLLSIDPDKRLTSEEILNLISPSFA